MIEAKCNCGGVFSVPEREMRTPITCADCNTVLQFAAGEDLPEGAGAGDFDARLVVASGPSQVGEHILIGGVAEILVGKLPDKHVVLPGKLVSRLHCKLNRLDFGPSRWELIDNSSTNGLFVNGERVASAELQSGDEIRIGNYTLRYSIAPTQENAPELAAAPASAAPATSTDGPICPSCQSVLPGDAKICINCGINLKTGRPIVMSKGLDQDDLAVRADTWIRIISWIIPFGLFPIASEAFGTRRPITTWVITIVTFLASIAFFIAVQSADDEPSPAILNMMHWSGTQTIDPEPAYDGVGFRWYQLFTSALIHDPSDVIGLAFHLGGNLLFLWVFGMRVNEMLGNLKFAIVYPLLAAGSGAVDMLAHLNHPLQPGLGASGAIMGLAGMYFVFFPIQRVHMAIWFRGGILTKWQCFYKLFTMQGFWLLLLWIIWNDVLPMFLDLRDGVGHWAHVGGFCTGLILALILLIARQADAHRGDIISVALGRYAWALLGHPGRASIVSVSSAAPSMALSQVTSN